MCAVSSLSDRVTSKHNPTFDSALCKRQQSLFLRLRTLWEFVMSQCSDLLLSPLFHGSVDCLPTVVCYGCAPRHYESKGGTCMLDTSIHRQFLLRVSLSRSLVHLVLSFVPCHEFFFCFPRLALWCRDVFSDSDLHRLYGQSRFGFTDRQWQMFAAHSWPQLQMPLSGYPSWLKAENDKLLRIRWNRPATVPTQPVHGGEKRWALECAHLHQHLHFATLHITRAAPNVTSTGSRILYILPRLIRALFGGRLMSMYARLDAVLTGTGRFTQYRSITLPSLPYFEYFDPSSITGQQPQLASIRRPSIGPATPHQSSASLEAETVESQVSTPSAADSITPAKAVELLREKASSSWPHTSSLSETVRLTSHQPCEEDYRGDCNQLIWFGRELRRAVRTEAAVNRVLQESSSGAGSVVVDLESSPVVWELFDCSLSSDYDDDNDDDGSTCCPTYELVLDAASVQQWAVRAWEAKRQDAAQTADEDDRDEFAEWLGVATHANNGSHSGHHSYDSHDDEADLQRARQDWDSYLVQVGHTLMRCAGRKRKETDNQTSLVGEQRGQGAEAGKDREEEGALILTATEHVACR